MDESTVALIKVAATVAGATATVIGVISKPLWSKLNKLGSDCQQQIATAQTALDERLITIGSSVDGLKSRVGEQNGRLGKLEATFSMHEEHDDERHREITERRREVLGALDGLRTDLNTAVRELRQERREKRGQ